MKKPFHLDIDEALTVEGIQDRYVVFDIETQPQALELLKSSMPAFDATEVKVGNIKDPALIAAKVDQAKAKHEADYLNKAALSPVTGKLAAIGLLVIQNGKAVEMSFMDDGTPEWEVVALELFWSHWVKTYSAHRTIWVGHNIFDFDLPWLVNRSRILNITIPATVYNFKGNRVFFSEKFADTRTVWLLGRKPTDVISNLDHVSRALGFNGKNGNGADFGNVLKETPEVAAAYLKCDLDLTAGIAVKLGIIEELK